jgi:hypothetical protein
MALDADDRITLLRVKIERAKHHLRDLERELLPTKVMLAVEHDCQTDSRKKLLVNLRHQYGTALAVGADFINQKLHIACDKAIANR